MRAVGHRHKLLDRMIRDSVELGLAHHTIEDVKLDGRKIRLKQGELINFGSCSYLGLELDPRLIAGAREALEAFGTSFSSSRAYVQTPHYRQLGDLLEQMFGYPAEISQSTTLGHLAAIPVLVDRKDAIVIDEQVHASVRMACAPLTSLGVPLESFEHNQLDRLEDAVHRLSASHQRVWVFVDGVYSMFGDFAPIDGLHALLERYPALHLYVDDAHGLSCFGPRGSGWALSQAPLHPRMVLAGGLSKGFGSAGGVLVFPDESLKAAVRNCGGPMIFAGPLAPAAFGASIASARIHLSGEIDERQQALHDRIADAEEMLRACGLPTISDPRSPVRFVGLGAPRVARRVVGGLIEDGFFTNIAQFPAVAIGHSGLRFMINAQQRFEDIEALCAAIDRRFAEALDAERVSIDDIWRAFGREAQDWKPGELAGRTPNGSRASTSLVAEKRELRVECADSIDALDRDEWERLLGSRGGFGVDALRVLEASNRGLAPELEWKFRYYRVGDTSGRTRLLTFFCDSLWKADMLAPAEVSAAVEDQRKSDPYALCPRVFAMGSLLTEGNHLYLDPELEAGSDVWREVLELWLSALREDADRAGAAMTVIRDLPVAEEGGEGDVLAAFFAERGFNPMPSGEGHRLVLDWQTEEELIERLPRRSRYLQRRFVQPWNDAYEVEFVSSGTRSVTQAEIDRCYSLYLAVKSRNLGLNTFELPREIFSRAATEPGWELMLMRESGVTSGEIVGLAVSVRGTHEYTALIAGLDYAFVESRGLYRQLLRQVILRAHSLGREGICLGLGASLWKRRFGGVPIPQQMFMRIDDASALNGLAAVMAELEGAEL